MKTGFGCSRKRLKNTENRYISLQKKSGKMVYYGQRKFFRSVRHILRSVWELRITALRSGSRRPGGEACSSAGNLNFNWKLVLIPPELLDYVVVHELAHRKEMNHSPRFWAVVEKELPDYRDRREKLKILGRQLG